MGLDNRGIFINLEEICFIGIILAIYKSEIKTWIYEMEIVFKNGRKTKFKLKQCGYELFTEALENAHGKTYKGDN